MRDGRLRALRQLYEARQCYPRDREPTPLQALRLRQNEGRDLFGELLDALQAERRRAVRD